MLTHPKSNSSKDYIYTCFPDYFSFGRSAVTDCVDGGVLRGRPFGGVMITSTQVN